MMRPIATIAISLVLVACAPEFDRADWAAARSVDAAENHRAEMVDDAERAGLRPGATRVFVRELLGEPDSDETDEHLPEPETGGFDFYEMGVMPYFPGQEYLIVHYDASDVVTDVRVIHDN